MNRHIRSVCIFLVLSALVLHPLPVSAQSALRISSINDNRTAYTNQTIPQYDKFELTFQIDGVSAANLQIPYLSASQAGTYLGKLVDQGISVDAVFLPPGETDWTKGHRQPGFYYQSFLDQTKSYKQWIYPTNQFAWKVRFAPNKTGTWNYRIDVRDKGGTASSPIGSFSVVDTGNKGFIRVAKDDARYFEFESGPGNTYFSGLGYNLAMSALEVNDTKENVLAKLSENKINFLRTWLQPLNIYTSAWSEWTLMPPPAINPSDSYLYRTPVLPLIDSYAPDGQFMWYLSNTSTWYAACAFIGHAQPKQAILSNTNYFIKIKYRNTTIPGPLDSTKPHGLVVQISNGWLGNACSAGYWNNGSTEPIIRATKYGQASTVSTEISGVWNSGINNFLPNLYISLENTASGSRAYIESIEMREMTGGTAENPILTGPNIIDKYSPDEHLYMAQRPSYRMDKIVESLKAHDVYIRPVLLEKSEYLANKTDPYGNPLMTDDATLVYGTWRREYFTRFMQKAWFRYVQARWGYSTNIHSWELMNEGDPNNSNHYALTDELGKYMHCGVFGVDVPDLDGNGNGDGDRCLSIYDHPNDHPVSTSTWHSYPVTNFWGNPKYPNVDYADFHLYTPGNTDAAENTSSLSLSRGAITANGPRKPVIRGEGSFSDNFATTSGIYRDDNGDGLPDAKGLWLHNLLWAQLNAGGMYDPSEWAPAKFIYEYVCTLRTGTTRCDRDPVTGETLYHIRFDYRPMYKSFAAFISGIPLNNGKYTDLAATVSHPSLRVLGQKDLANRKAHGWIQNSSHTWKNFVDGVIFTPLSATVAIPGFPAQSPFRISWWDTDLGTISSSQIVNTDSAGTLILTVSGLTTDTAFLAESTTVSPTPTTSLTPTLTTAKPGDANADNRVDGLDYVIWLNHYGGTATGITNGDFNSDNRIDGLDYVMWLNNYGS